ncbi:1-deoxy-D-xylulose-5-phosphate synthase [Bacteroides caecimuris]|uniref:1-deoxy-D-xylulose-5-phosphate synthase n=1 Tax=Bacteroides caecimuris TaxID=1796613 RepID=UPI002573146E|nr:1-deoxy-D-xylulose-5-phosphate synthase [Bacteroides caecimuris]
MYLETINSPSDLKKLNIKQLNSLAGEIRDALIKKMSIGGGHLASNLGIIEATIALHYVFESPKDKIIFDVSHQCYTHKILTGRKAGYIDPKFFDLIEGYTKPSESDHDIFRLGHTATSISLASGMAKARDLRGGNEKIIAVIGDGALSGGEAFEGLDYCGSEINGNFIVVFNDNQMSIPENHGGIYEGFKKLRDTEGKSNDNLFKVFGYDYIFVKDGNNIKDVVEALNRIKDNNHPIVVHICTVKGKGYRYSENNPEKTHFVRKFDVDTGEEVYQFNGERYDRIVRDYLLEKMKQDPLVVTMIASVPNALSFSKEYRLEAGRQFVDVGIAEEHAVTMLAGLAKGGCKPVFTTLSTFFQRTYDQISQDLCINETPATLIVVDASVYATNDITHVGIFDIPMLSNIPNLVYLAPTNKQEYLAMLDWSIEQKKHPVAIRAPRNGVFYAKYDVDTEYNEINKYMVIQQGEEVAIIALGDFFQLGEELSTKITEKYGYVPTIINPRFITGLDKELLTRIKDNHNIVITLEDGILDGGFGQKIASFYGDSNIKVLNYGLKKEFLDRYNVNAIMEENHLKPEMIIHDMNALN